MTLWKSFASPLLLEVTTAFGFPFVHNLLKRKPTVAYRGLAEACMRRRRKKQSQRMSARTEPSSQVEDLRSDSLERLDVIACDARWVQEQIEHGPKLPSGEAINLRIAHWREKTKALIVEYVAGLTIIFPNDLGAVRRELDALWPLFNERASGWVTAATLDRWRRLALAKASRQIGTGHSPKGVAAVPSWEILKNLRSILRSDAAKYLNCTPRTVYSFVKNKRLNTAKSGRVICDDKLRIELLKKHGESYR